VRFGGAYIRVWIGFWPKVGQIKISRGEFIRPWLVAFFSFYFYFLDRFVAPSGIVLVRSRRQIQPSSNFFIISKVAFLFRNFLRAKNKKRRKKERKNGGLAEAQRTQFWAQRKNQKSSEELGIKQFWKLAQKTQGNDSESIFWDKKYLKNWALWKYRQKSNLKVVLFYLQKWLSEGKLKARTKNIWTGWLKIGITYSAKK
jgi:hypothetical protein